MKNVGAVSRCPKGGNILWALLVTLVVGGGFVGLIVLLANRDPDAVEERRMWEVDEAELMSQMEESVALEARFEAVWDSGQDAELAFSLLEQAIDAQESVCGMVGEHDFGGMERLHRLQRRLEETKGRFFSRRIVDLLHLAEPLAEEGKADEAAAFVSEALDLREWINKHLAGSALVDAKEEARLRQWLSSLESFDASAKVDTWVRRGRSSMSGENWEEAKRWLGKALELQESINREASSTNHARPVLAQQLRDELRWMEAARLDAQVGRYLKQAEMAEKSGDKPARQVALQNAFELQGVINEEFRPSPYASESRLQEIGAKLAHGESLGMRVALGRKVSGLDEALRSQDWTAVRQLLGELESELNGFLKTYDRGLLMDQRLPDRVVWMIRRLDDLPGIAAYFDALWQSVSGEEGYWLLRSELSQEAYVLLVGENPSRHRGDELPVESVSLEEAERFCDYLSWALGYEVVLPSAEACLATGFNDMDRGWFSHNSGFETHPVESLEANDAGFWGVYGNVAEWLADGRVFGGRGIDPAVVTREAPIESMESGGRSRWVGFRVMKRVD